MGALIAALVEDGGGAGDALGACGATGADGTAGAGVEAGGVEVDEGVNEASRLASSLILSVIAFAAI